MAFLPYRLVNVPCQGQFIQGFSSIQADKCATHEGQSVQGFSPIQADKCAKHQGQFIQGFLSYSGWYVCHVKISVFLILLCNIIMCELVCQLNTVLSLSLSGLLSLHIICGFMCVAG